MRAFGARTPMCSDNPDLSDPLCPRVPCLVSVRYRSTILSVSVFKLIAAFTLRKKTGISGLRSPKQAVIRDGNWDSSGSCFYVKADEGNGNLLGMADERILSVPPIGEKAMRRGFQL